MKQLVMISSNFRFEQDPFGVYDFKGTSGKLKVTGNSSFLKVLVVLLSVLSLALVIALRKTIWKLISNKEYPFPEEIPAVEDEMEL